MSRRFSGNGLNRRVARGGAGAGLLAPQTVANLLAWWRADSGIVIDTGVSSWTSKVNGYVLSQATGVNQPVFNTADADYASKPSLEFNSTAGMRSSDAASTWKFLHDGTGMTVFIAQKLKDTGNNLALWTSGIGPGGHGIEFLQWDGAGGTFPRTAYGAGSYYTDGTEATLYNLAGVAGWQTQTGASQFKRTTSAWDAVTIAGGPPSSSNPTVSLSVAYNGGGNPWVGSMAEIIVYNRYLGASELSTVYSYLASRYGW